jgi:thiol-disulfide isomerase/thioredoxin
MAAPDADGTAVAEDALDDLLAAGVVDEADDGTLSTTTDFEATRGVYYDSYVDVDDEEFHRSVADVFGVSVDEAAAYLAENDVSREEFVDFLALRSFLDDPPAQGTLALMARLLGEIGPETPVPEPIEVVTDETYETFLTEHPDAVLTVWRHYCQPCAEMKDDLDELLAAIPDDVAVGGLDGEGAPRFRLDHGVDAAPAVLLFRDGERHEVATGRTTPETFATLIARVYGDDDTESGPATDGASDS